MSDRRTFDFDSSVSMSDALQTIKAALEDEGLTIGAKSGSMDGVTSVIASGRKRVMVPGSRIVTIEDHASMEAAFAKQIRPRR